jgi:hypothetical protein
MDEGPESNRHIKSPLPNLEAERILRWQDTINKLFISESYKYPFLSSQDLTGLVATCAKLLWDYVNIVRLEPKKTAITGAQLWIYVSMIVGLATNVGALPIASETATGSVNSLTGWSPTNTLATMTGTANVDIVYSTVHPSAANLASEIQPSAGIIWDELKSRVASFILSVLLFNEPLILIIVAMLICSVSCFLGRRLPVVGCFFLFGAVYIQIEDWANLESHPGLLFG